jgi:hypothetical protein
MATVDAYRRARALRAKAYTLHAEVFDLHAEADRLFDDEENALQCEGHAASYRALAARITGELAAEVVPEEKADEQDKVSSLGGT